METESEDSSDEQESRKVINVVCHNLPSDVSTKDIHDRFSSFGAVVHVTRMSPTSAIVEFATKAAAMKLMCKLPIFIKSPSGVKQPVRVWIHPGLKGNKPLFKLRSEVDSENDVSDDDVAQVEDASRQEVLGSLQAILDKFEETVGFTDVEREENPQTEGFSGTDHAKAFSTDGSSKLSEVQVEGRKANVAKRISRLSAMEGAFAVFRQETMDRKKETASKEDAHGAEVLRSVLNGFKDLQAELERLAISAQHLQEKNEKMRAIFVNLIKRSDGMPKKEN